MQDLNAPESLRDFQIGYGKYLRNPSKRALPKGVPARRSQIYEELLFNNISGFIDNCFPVTKSLFEESQWLGLCRAFYDEWRCTTPIFSQIPNEFVRFISERPIGENLAPWVPELLHYEWVELEVDLSEADTVSPTGEHSLIVNPTAKLLAYQWPVHRISSDFQPEENKQTCLVVYRDDNEKVRFSEVNATTLMLLQFMQEWQQPMQALNEIKQFLQAFAEQIGHPDPAALTEFGLSLLNDLKSKKILVGDIL